jgi:hypothetical protein
MMYTSYYLLARCFSTLLLHYYCYCDDDVRTLATTWFAASPLIDRQLITTS